MKSVKKKVALNKYLQIFIDCMYLTIQGNIATYKNKKRIQDHIEVPCEESEEVRENKTTF